MMNHIKKLFMWVTSATRSEGSTKSRRTKLCRDVRIIQKGALSLCKVTISYVFLLSKDEPALKKTIPWSVNPQRQGEEPPRTLEPRSERLHRRTVALQNAC